MKYSVRLYNRKGIGITSTEVEAKTHLEALKLVVASTKAKWLHGTVVSKTVRRYTNKLKLIKDIPQYFKDYPDKPSVLILFGNIPEQHRFFTEKERDKYFEKVTCTPSTPVASVESDKEQKDTTVFSEETNDSRSGLTEKKTSNGSVAIVTPLDLATRSNTAKNSGKNKSDVSEKTEWNFGCENVPSKSEPSIFWAKIILDPRLVEKKKWAQLLNGKYTHVTKSGALFVTPDGYILQPEQLYFFKNPVIKAKVKNVQEGTKLSEKYTKAWTSDMNLFIGQEMEFSPCEDHLQNTKVCFATDWVDVISISEAATMAVVKNIRIGTTTSKNGITDSFVESMEYHGKGWKFWEDWLDFS